MTPVRTAAAPLLRRHRSTALLVLGLVAAVLVVVLVGGAGVRTSTPLDPDNPGPSGAQALARVLADQGVPVTVARSADALEATAVDADTTVLVTSTESLGESTSRRLLDHVGDARLVLAEPGPGTTEAFGISAPPYDVTLSRPRAADCSDPAFAGLSIQVDRALEYDAPGGCFPGEHGALVVEREDGVVLLGAAQALSNDQVLRADNAAAVLRLLGQGQRVVWYVPTVDDLVGDDGVSVETLLPPWIRPALWLGGIAAFALVLWRARRLGPLATEPLPVVVRAIETTRSRGRLYRKAGDRGHAAEALRRAARTRMAERLGLPAHTDPDEVVLGLARLLDRPAEELRVLLAPGTTPPATDHDLITLAGRLAELDREVRRT